MSALKATKVQMFRRTDGSVYCTGRSSKTAKTTTTY